MFRRNVQLRFSTQPIYSSSLGARHVTARHGTVRDTGAQEVVPGTPSPAAFAALTSGDERDDGDGPSSTGGGGERERALTSRGHVMIASLSPRGLYQTLLGETVRRTSWRSGGPQSGWLPEDQRQPTAQCCPTQPRGPVIRGGGVGGGIARLLSAARTTRSIVCGEFPGHLPPPFLYISRAPLAPCWWLMFARAACERAA